MLRLVVEAGKLSLQTGQMVHEENRGDGGMMCTRQRQQRRWQLVEARLDQE